MLLNVAGFLQPGFLDKTNGKMIDMMFDVNTKGPIYGTKVVTDHMKSKQIKGKAHPSGSVVVSFFWG